MRLIYTLKDHKNAQSLSTFLKKEGIENKLEIKKIDDWGSDDYGTFNCHIWIYDEDQVATAIQWVQYFEENPNDPRFQNISLPQIKKEEPKIKTTKKNVKNSIGIITLYLLIGCSLLFILSNITRPTIQTPIPKNLPLAPLFLAPIEKIFYYDWPHAYEIVDKLDKAYGIKELENSELLPTSGKILLSKFYQTPFWQGFYTKLVSFFKESQFSIDAPMFEKIKEGEIWRLFTPAVLHANLLHLFFNMMWLLVLGKQMEEKIPKWRYILFIIITAIVSNTAQYLMSGTNFIGFSGVLCAMIAFIWIRQKKAAWEGYQLLPSSIAMISIIIFGIFGIQLFSFILETRGISPIAPPIANTAHLSGAFIGYLLGLTNFFSRRL